MYALKIVGGTSASTDALFISLVKYYMEQTNPLIILHHQSLLTCMSLQLENLGQIAQIKHVCAIIQTTGNDCIVPSTESHGCDLHME